MKTKSIIFMISCGIFFLPVFVRASAGFMGADFARGVEDLQYLSSLSNAKINFIGSEKVFWADIEPTVTSGYDWTGYDAQVKSVEASGGDILPTIGSASTWATAIDANTLIDVNMPSSPPKSQYQTNYSNFIKSFVERYDKDGVNDMPGLLYAHNYLQIEDEAQNLGDSWFPSSACAGLASEAYYRCATDEYGAMLKLAYQAAKTANSNARVVSFSFNPGDYFDNNPANPSFSYPQLVYLKSLFLDRALKDYSAYYDTIGVQCNYDYTGIPAWIKYMKDNYGTSLGKPIQCSDAGSLPLLGKHIYQSEKYFTQYPFMHDADIIKILSDGTANIRYAEIKSWWEGEKAKLSIKKAVVAAGAGADNIFFQFIMPPGGWNNIWGYSGLLGYGTSKENDGPMGTPRAITHALGQLNNKAADLRAIENLKILSAGADPYAHTWLYRMHDLQNKISYIAWKDSGANNTIDLSGYLSGMVKATPIITQNDINNNPIIPTTVTVSSNAIPISAIPVFIEAGIQDAVSPIISSISTSNITPSTASITWTTNEPADGQLEFGTSACPCQNTTPIVPDMLTSHIINLSNLTPSTTYYYRVKSKDASGNLSVSSSYSFKTAVVSIAAPINKPFTSINPNYSYTSAQIATIEQMFGSEIFMSKIQQKSFTGGDPKGLYTGFIYMAPSEALGAGAAYVAKDSLGKPYINLFGRYLATFWDPQWLSFQYNYYQNSGFDIESQDIIFMDESRPRVYNFENQVLPPQIDTDAEWKNAVLATVTYVRERLPADKILIANSSKRYASDTYNGLDIADPTRADYVLLEDFINDASTTQGEFADMRVIALATSNQKVVALAKFDLSATQNLLRESVLAKFLAVGKSSDIYQAGDTGGWNASPSYAPESSINFGIPIDTVDANIIKLTTPSSVIIRKWDSGFTSIVNFTGNTQSIPASLINKCRIQFSGSSRIGVDGVIAATFNFTSNTDTTIAHGIGMVFHECGYVNPDITKPTISGAQTSNITPSTASITWTTNEPADGQLEFGTTACPCQNTTPIVPDMLTSHVINLSSITSGTTYYYRVKSKDAAGNLAVSAVQSFITVNQQAIAVNIDAGKISGPMKNISSGVNILDVPNKRTISDAKLDRFMNEVGKDGYFQIRAYLGQLNPQMDNYLIIDGNDDSVTLQAAVNKIHTAGGKVVVQVSGVPQWLSSCIGTDCANTEGIMPKYAKYPPTDYEKWRSAVAGLINKYNSLGIAIDYFKIYGETNIGTTWWGDGSALAIPSFLEHYKQTAQAILSILPNAKIGGIDVAASWTPIDLNSSSVFAKWVKDLINYCEINKLPLDIWGWHQYGTYTQLAISDAQSYRNYLNSHGFGNSLMLMGEWNIDGKGQYLSNKASTHFGSANVFAQLIDFAHSALDSQTYYTLLDGYAAYGQLSSSGDAKPNFNAFKLFSMMGKQDEIMSSTDENQYQLYIPLTSYGVTVNQKDIRVIASKSSQYYYVAATYYVPVGPTETPDYALTKDISIIVNNLPPGGYDYTIYKISKYISNAYFDGTNPDLEVIEQGHNTGAYVKNMTLSKYDTVLIKFTTDIIPPVISSVSTSNITPSTASITWTTDELTDGYVEFGTASCPCVNKTPVVPDMITAHIITLSNLSSNTTYNYRIITKDASGNIATSQNYTFTTQSVPDTQGPSAITTLTVSDIGQTSLTLSWIVPADTSGVATYDIRYSTALIDESTFSSATQISQTPIPATSGSTKTQYVSVGFIPSTTYSFAIKSTDALGNISQISNIATGTTLSDGVDGGFDIATIEAGCTETTTYSTLTGKPCTKISTVFRPFYTFSNDRAVTYGMKDSTDVRELQKILHFEGILSLSSAADGSFGPSTKASVITFQKKYAINPAQGNVGPLTKTKLNALYGSTAISTIFYRNLTLGSKGDDVKKLQQLLNTDIATRITSTGAGSLGNETTYFGAATKAAVIKYQKKYDITPSQGYVGPKTRGMLEGM